MRVGYVVLYVTDGDACRDFWTNKVGMELQETTPVPGAAIYKVGFSNQAFSFELVPLSLMQENPHGLDLATPSICFYDENPTAWREVLISHGVTTTEITDRGGKQNFAFSDNENRWFAVLEGK
jgi:lactoylglutathione lyase